jgi:hypothetical protein
MTPESIWGMFVVIPDILITLLINPLDGVWGSIRGDYVIPVTFHITLNLKK